MAENQYIYLNSDLTGNELNSDAKVAAQIVLGLAILIITLLLSLPRFLTNNTALFLLVCLNCVARIVRGMIFAFSFFILQNLYSVDLLWFVMFYE